jgi:hypothetical protein
MHAIQHVLHQYVFGALIMCLAIGPPHDNTVVYKHVESGLHTFRSCSRTLSRIAGTGKRQRRIALSLQVDELSIAHACEHPFQVHTTELDMVHTASRKN